MFDRNMPTFNPALNRFASPALVLDVFACPDDVQHYKQGQVQVSDNQK
jgi:hypothetical protein